MASKVFCVAARHVADTLSIERIRPFHWPAGDILIAVKLQSGVLYNP